MPSDELTETEFVARFTAHAIKVAGFDTFADGTKVADYCAEIAPSYYQEEHFGLESPEECAEADVAYWGED